MTRPSRHAIARFSRVGATIGAIALVSGCGVLSRQSLDNFSLTYKINIQQGVVVTQEMAEQLKPGMTREQVRFVLGTPILVDPFHAERWDYPFRFQPGRGRIEERRFTVYFENDRLVRFDGDPLPTEEEFAASRNFATTRIAKAPLVPGGPPTPGATAPNVGGATATPANVNVPVRPRNESAPETSNAPPPAESDSSAPR